MKPIWRPVLLAVLFIAACGGNSTSGGPLPPTPGEPAPVDQVPDETTPTNQGRQTLVDDRSDPCSGTSLVGNGLPTPRIVTVLTDTEYCIPGEPSSKLTATRTDCGDGTYAYGVRGYGFGHQDGVWQAFVWDPQTIPLNQACE